MKILICIILLLLVGNAFGAKVGKEVLSEQAAYERLGKDADFWVNSPKILDDAIIFFFKGDAKKVVIAGDFNGWKRELLMKPKDTNILQYSWDERLPKGTYKYKYIVDDVWISDPFNTNVIVDESGQQVSYFELTEDFIPHAKYPLFYKDDIYIFKYENTAADSVYLVGDFNNWNPYSHKMESKGAGEFELRVRLKPGMHTYCFVVDGDWKADPMNRDQFSDEVGNIVNVLYAGNGKHKNK